MGKKVTLDALTGFDNDINELKIKDEEIMTWSKAVNEQLIKEDEVTIP